MIKRQMKGTIAGVLSFAMVLGNCTFAGAADGTSPLAEDTPVKVTGTSSSGSNLWQPLKESSFTNGSQKGDASIVVDTSVEYQKYAGIGFSLDETSISNLWKLDEKTREETIKKLADPETGAGLDQFRITIGSPDCIEHIPFWSYDVLPEGVEDDFGLEYFSIEKDKEYHIIDTIKLIQKYNPDAKFFGSAWSAPAWMTTTGTLTGKVEDGAQKSELRDDCIEVFAKYYAKTIKAFEEEGITISAITELNEPGMDVIYPAMNLTIEQQQKLAIAIKKEFKEQGIETELWMHDFNFWDWKYGDLNTYKNFYRIFEGELGEETKEAADGVGFHPYWGEASVMWDTYYETGKPVYLTESGGMDPGTILSYFRYNCSSYSGWTQVTDQDGGTLHWTDDKSIFVPESDIETWAAIGKRPGAYWKGRLVTVDTGSNKADYNNYVLGGLGQMAKYLDYGATRVYSSDSSKGISNVVYYNGETDTTRDYVMVVNNTGEPKTVDVNMSGKSALLDVPSGFSTFLWTMDKVSTEGNHKPVISKIDDINTKQFEKMTFQINAADEDNDALTYYGYNLPEGASVNPSTGLFEWTPGAAGEYTFEVAVTDGKENSTVEFKVTVEAAPIPVPDNSSYIKVGAVIKDNDVQNYKLDVKEAGNYILTANYTTNDIWSVSGQKIDVAVDGKNIDSKNLAITWSGSGAVRIPVQLETGLHDLELTFHDTNYTVNFLTITKVITHEVPGKAEAEDYSDSFGVNLEPEGNAYKVAETNKGDWMEYQVDAKTEGTYTISMRAGTPNADVQLQVYADDKAVSVIDMEKTGDGWGAVDYKEGSTSTPFKLEKGKHTIKLEFISDDGGNIDYLVFEKTGETSKPTDQPSEKPTKQPSTPSYPSYGNISQPQGSQSQAPAVSATPATSTAPEASTAPGTSIAPEASAAPGTSAAPATSTAPEASAAPEVTKAPGTTTEIKKDDVTGTVTEITTTINSDNVSTVVEKTTKTDGTQNIKETITETSNGIITITETLNSNQSNVELVKNIKQYTDGTVINTDAMLYTGHSEINSNYSAKNTITADFLKDAKDAGISDITLCITENTVDAVKVNDNKRMVIKIEVPQADGISVGKVILPEESIEGAVEGNRRFVVKMLNDNPEDSYTVTIPASELKKMQGDIDISINAGKVSGISGNKKGNIESILSANGIKAEDAAFVSIAPNNTEGGIKASAPVVTSSIKASGKAYVYCYNSKTGKLEEIANSKRTVLKNGMTGIEGYSGNDYVVTDKELSGKNVVTLLGQSKVSFNKTSVKKGGNIKATITLPSELKVKPSLKKDVSYAKQAAVITYKSSDSKVAKVSKNGTIKGKGKGNAEITVKIKLADNKVKTVKKKVTVK